MQVILYPASIFSHWDGMFSLNFFFFLPHSPQAVGRATNLSNSNKLGQRILLHKNPCTISTSIYWSEAPVCKLDCLWYFED